MTTTRGGRPRHPREAAPLGPRTSQRPTQRKPASAGQPGQQSGLARLIRRTQAAMDSRALTDYTLIRTIVLVLAGLGVVMVLSSSMASSFASSASVWSVSYTHLTLPTNREV